MLESIGGKELDEMKAARYDFSEDFRLLEEVGGGSYDAKAALLTEAPTGSSSRPGKHRRVEDEEVSVAKKSRTSDTPSSEKIQHKQDGWNCLVCTLYVFQFHRRNYFDLSISQNQRVRTPCLFCLQYSEGRPCLGGQGFMSMHLYA